MKTYGRLVPGMEPVLRQVVADKSVWDLGSGSLVWSVRLLEFGARSVVAIDKDPMPNVKREGLTRMESWFCDVDNNGIEMAFLSWPVNYYNPGLLGLLRTASIVIYLGSNVEGSACGNPRLFDHLYGREILHCVPHRFNTLIVYGEPIEHRRPLVGEEVAVFGGQMLSFGAAEEIAATTRVVLEVPGLLSF